jgi:hypothetical protein
MPIRGNTSQVWHTELSRGRCLWMRRGVLYLRLFRDVTGRDAGQETGTIPGRYTFHDVHLHSPKKLNSISVFDIR